MSELCKGVSFRSDPADVDRAHAGQIEAWLLLQRRENGDPDLGGQAVRRNSGRGVGISVFAFSCENTFGMLPCLAA